MLKAQVFTKDIHEVPASDWVKTKTSFSSFETARICNLSKINKTEYQFTD